MKTVLAASAASILVAVPAFAEDRGADPLTSEIIVTGSKLSGDFGAKSGIPIERVPQSVQIVTADDIIEQGARSVGDLLRGVPSATASVTAVTSCIG